MFRAAPQLASLSQRLGLGPGEEGHNMYWTAATCEKFSDALFHSNPQGSTDTGDNVLILHMRKISSKRCGLISDCFELECVSS